MKELKEKLDKMLRLAEKYKYALLVLLAGLVLLLLPSGSKEIDTGVQQSASRQQQTADDLESRLCSALEQINGAGRVDLVLTAEESRRDILATDDTETESRIVTVQTDGGTETVTVKSLYPVYRGALVVCDGADDPKVKLDILNAVSALTGLGSDKITVVKMKSS